MRAQNRSRLPEGDRNNTKHFLRPQHNKVRYQKQSEVWKNQNMWELNKNLLNTKGQNKLQKVRKHFEVNDNPSPQLRPTACQSNTLPTVPLLPASLALAGPSLSPLCTSLPTLGGGCWHNPTWLIPLPPSSCGLPHWPHPQLTTTILQ